jgi:hypothetical protein
MRIFEVTAERPLVRRIVDTSKPPENPYDFDGYLRGAAWYDEKSGLIKGIHVTDHPQNMLDTLKQGIPVGDRQHGDLGNGFYFSAAPQIWTSRSVGKWDFLQTMTPQQKQALAMALKKSITELPPSYIGQHERDNANRYIDEFLTGRYDPGVLVNLAGQPYNLQFWKPEYLQSLGIQPPQQPQEIEVSVAGRFAQLEQNIWDTQADELRAQGFDGAFTQGGFSTTPQFVVFHNAAIKQFGPWVPGQS